MAQLFTPPASPPLCRTTRAGHRRQRSLVSPSFSHPLLPAAGHERCSSLLPSGPLSAGYANVWCLQAGRGMDSGTEQPRCAACLPSLVQQLINGSLRRAGTAVGGLIGGCLGDAAAQRWPLRGRIAVTQFSVSIGIPFAWLVFKVGGWPACLRGHDAAGQSGMIVLGSCAAWSALVLTSCRAKGAWSSLSLPCRACRATAHPAPWRCMLLYC